MKLLEKTDEEILEIANPIWDDLVKYSNNKDYIRKGLKKIKPEYYVIKKDKIGVSGGLLAKKLFLDDNFKLVKIFKEYLLYKVPKEININQSSNS